MKFKTERLLKSTEKNSSTKDTDRSVSQEIPPLLFELECFYRVHKTSPLTLYTVCLRSVLILSFHQLLDLPSNLFLSTLYLLLASPVRVT